MGVIVLIGLIYIYCDVKASLVTTYMGEQLFTWLLLMMSLVVIDFLLSFLIWYLEWDQGLNCISFSEFSYLL